MNNVSLIKTLFPALMAYFLIAPSHAEEVVDVTVHIRNHLFFPENIIVPADKKIRLTIVNHDNTPEEFESYPLNREKIVPANSKTIIYFGPLKTGRYDFFGEFHPTTAVGAVVVPPASTHDEGR